MLPTLWFRNQWSGARAPTGRCCRQVARQPARASSRPSHPNLGERYLYCEGDAPLLFTENETNTQRIFGVPNRTPYVKDGINNYIVHGQQDAVNPEQEGHQGAAHYRLTVEPGRMRRRFGCASSDVAPANWRAAVRSAAFDDALRGRAARRPTSSTRRSFPRR